MVAGRWGTVPSCWVGMGWGSGVSLGLSDRLSFSPAHSRAVQPAAITTPQPLCHGNAIESSQSAEGGECGSTAESEESRRFCPSELELDCHNEQPAGWNGNLLLGKFLSKWNTLNVECMQIILFFYCEWATVLVWLVYSIKLYEIVDVIFCVSSNVEKIPSG